MSTTGLQIDDTTPGTGAADQDRLVHVDVVVGEGVGDGGRAVGVADDREVGVVPADGADAVEGVGELRGCRSAHRSFVARSTAYWRRA